MFRLKNLFFILLVILFFAGAQVNAQYGQYGQPTEETSLLIDKLVNHPAQLTKGGERVFVDNLSPSDTRFKPSDEVTFKLKVKNLSYEDISNVKVEDNFPSYLIPISYPGELIENEGKIVFNTGEIKSQEEKEYLLKFKIVEQSKLPLDKGIICLVNRAFLIYSDSYKDKDTSQLCIEKQVMQVTTVPKAGIENGIFLISISLISLLLGIYIRKNFSST